MNRPFLIPVLLLLSAVTVRAQSITDSEFNVIAADGVTLGGTLTLPANGTPKAALVLATGSGQQNRDEELLGFRPFKVIAETLAENGYAVLRLDDRGCGSSGGDFATATTNGYAADLCTALDALRSAVNAPAGILGHSEGGAAAIKAANRCDFIITLAAPAWPGDSIIMSQARAISVAMTGSWPGEALQRRLLNLVKSPLPSALLAAQLSLEIAEGLGEAAGIPAVRQQIQQQVQVMCSPGYREPVSHDPADEIRTVSVPWLALNGDKDMQVLPENLSAIARLNPQAVTLLLPGHNHLFQQAATGLPAEYSTLPAPVSAETLEAILDFLSTLCGR